MKKDTSINLKLLISFPIIIIGFGLSIASYFFNKMLPEGIISTDFPPFHLFLIGMIFLIIGLFLFFWKKIQKKGRKSIGIIITLVVILIIIISLPIIFHSSTISTGRLINKEEVVWQANQSINTVTVLKDVFESNVMEFWVETLNILEENQLSYPNNAVPLLEKCVLIHQNSILQ